MKAYLVTSFIVACAFSTALQDATTVVFIDGPGREQISWQRDEAIRIANDLGWEKIPLSGDSIAYFNMDRLGVSSRRDQLKLIQGMLDSNTISQDELTGIVGRQLKSLFGDEYIRKLGEFDPVQVSIRGSALLTFGDGSQPVFRSIPAG